MQRGREIGDRCGSPPRVDCTLAGSDNRMGRPGVGQGCSRKTFQSKSLSNIEITSGVEAREESCPTRREPPFL